MLNNVSIFYNWYDHLARDKYPSFVNKIQQALDERNYENFIALYNENEKKNIVTLPDTATIWYNDLIIGEAEILNEEVFKLIDGSEYECG